MVSLRVIAIILTLLIGCFVVHGQHFKRSCMKMERFDKCAKPLSCQPSCQNRRVVCKAACSPGCVCKGRLVRDSQKKCIPQTECRSNYNRYQKKYQ